MLDFPAEPRYGAVYIAFGFGSLSFRYDGARWTADAADVLPAFERMAQERERHAQERVILVFERVYGRPFPDNDTGIGVSGFGIRDEPGPTNPELRTTNPDTEKELGT